MASATEAMAAQEIPQFSSGDGEEWVVISDTLLPPKLGLQIYVGATFAVMAAYALLLMISLRYIKVVVIPAIILVFIAALWVKFWVKGRSQHRNNRTANLSSGSGKAQRLLPMVLLSYCLQLIQLRFALVDDITNGQQSGNFVISHFLLFFSSALGALAVMMAALRIGTSRGVAQAQQALHRTFTVILVITVYTMATEWMEEDMVLICMPGLIAALVWFTVNFDHGEAFAVSVANKVTSRRSIVIVLPAAMTLVAYLTATCKFSFENEILGNYLYTRTLCSCALSAVLSYFSVWMIHQWPGNTDSAKVLIQLLEFSAKICFGISAMVLILPTMLTTCSSASLQSFGAVLIRLGQWLLYSF